MQTKAKDGSTASVLTYDKQKALKPIKDSTEAQKQAQESTEAQAENITASVIDKNYLKTRIIDCIKEYAIEYEIDIYSLKQLQWNSVLEYISDRVIKPIRIDYRNTDNIINLYMVYQSVCRLYNKSTSVYGYSIISSISYSTLMSYKDKTIHDTYIDIDNDYYCIDSMGINNYRLQHKDNKIIALPNTAYSQVVKMATLDREHCLTDKTEDGSIPSLALGKIEFGWIESQKEKMQVEMIQKYTLPQDILKEYSENN